MVERVVSTAHVEPVALGGSCHFGSIRTAHQTNERTHERFARTRQQSSECKVLRRERENGTEALTVLYNTVLREHSRTETDGVSE